MFEPKFVPEFYLLVFLFFHAMEEIFWFGKQIHFLFRVDFSSDPYNFRLVCEKWVGQVKNRVEGIVLMSMNCLKSRSLRRKSKSLRSNSTKVPPSIMRVLLLAKNLEDRFCFGLFLINFFDFNGKRNEPVSFAVWHRLLNNLLKDIYFFVVEIVSLISMSEWCDFTKFGVLNWWTWLDVLLIRALNIIKMMVARWRWTEKWPATKIKCTVRNGCNWIDAVYSRTQWLDENKLG